MVNAARHNSRNACDFAAFTIVKRQAAMGTVSLGGEEIARND